MINKGRLVSLLPFNKQPVMLKLRTLGFFLSLQHAKGRLLPLLLHARLLLMHRSMACKKVVVWWNVYNGYFIVNTMTVYSKVIGPLMGNVICEAGGCKCSWGSETADLLELPNSSQPDLCLLMTLHKRHAQLNIILCTSYPLIGPCSNTLPPPPHANGYSSSSLFLPFFPVSFWTQSAALAANSRWGTLLLRPSCITLLGAEM